MASARRPRRRAWRSAETRRSIRPKVAIRKVARLLAVTDPLVQTRPPLASLAASASAALPRLVAAHAVARTP